MDIVIEQIHFTIIWDGWRMLADYVLWMDGEWILNFGLIEQIHLTFWISGQGPLWPTICWIIFFVPCRAVQRRLDRGHHWLMTILDGITGIWDWGWRGVGPSSRKHHQIQGLPLRCGSVPRLKFRVWINWLDILAPHVTSRPPGFLKCFDVHNHGFLCHLHSNDPYNILCEMALYFGIWIECVLLLRTTRMFSGQWTKEYPGEWSFWRSPKY